MASMVSLELYIGPRTERMKVHLYKKRWDRQMPGPDHCFMLTTTRHKMHSVYRILSELEASTTVKNSVVNWCWANYLISVTCRLLVDYLNL